MATEQPWTTNRPTGDDTPGTEQPDLDDDSVPGALDGDRLRGQHLHTLRDKIQYLDSKVENSTTLPTQSLGSHKGRHEPGGGDAMTVDAAAGTGSLRTLGTGAQQACAGNDGRLSDDRDPTSHASEHESAGGDVIAHQNLSGAGSNAHSAIDTHLGSSSNPHTVTKSQVSLGNVENLKVKLDATTAPTVDNDVDEGYSVGSRWCDVTADKEYVCLDNTDGAAVWTETTGGGSASPLTTKGDLYGHTGSADARIAGGSEGQLPFSRAAESTGIAWEDPGSFAPGADSVQVLNLVPSSNVDLGTTGGTAWADITGASGSLVVPVAGDYVFEVEGNLSMVSGTPGVVVSFRLDIDGDTVAPTSEQSWNCVIGATGNWNPYGFKTHKVALTAGTKTVKVQWRYRASDDGDLVRMSQNISHLNVVASVVQGSGLGGTILSRTSDTTNRDETDVSAYEEITALEHTFTVAEGEDVLLTLTLSGFKVSGTVPSHVYSGYKLDSDAWVRAGEAGVSAVSLTRNLGFSVPLEGLSAGEHTVKIGFGQNAAGTARVNNSAVPAVSAVWQYKGGQDPIYQDGTLISSIRAGTDIIGPGLIATMVDDRLQLESNAAADGVEVVTGVQTGGNFQVTTLASVGWDDITGCTASIDLAKDEVAELKYVNQFRGDAAALAQAKARIVYGGGPTLVVEGIITTQNITEYRNHALAGEFTAPSSGTYSFKVQGTRFGDNATWTINGGTLSVRRIRGGYVVPENTPILVDGSLSGDTYQYNSAPGAAARQWVKMIDNVRYYHDGALDVDIGTSGIGGLEASQSLPPVASGTISSFAAPSGDSQQVTAGTGTFTSAMVGHDLYTRDVDSNADQKENWASTEILSYVSGTQVTRHNPNGVSETPSGTIDWSVGHAWIYSYLVPTTGQLCDIVASLNPPYDRDGNLWGPDDYTVWKYLGPLFYDGTGFTRQEAQRGAQIVEKRSPVFQGGSVALDTAFEPMQLGYFVPRTADSVDLELEVVTSNNKYQLLISYNGTSSFTAVSQDSNGDSDSKINATTPTVPLTDSELRLWRWLSRSAGSTNCAWLNIHVRGYRDKYLAGSAPQAQAQAAYAPNPVTASASGPVTLTADDSGKLYTNEGATAEVVFNLPTAVAGLEFSFIVQDTDGIQVNAASGDTIRIAASVSAAAGLIETTTIGNSVKLKAINATEWIAMSHEGTWTVT